MFSLWLVIGLLLGTPAQASFSIYDNYDPLIIQAAYGLSSSCLAALSVHAYQKPLGCPTNEKKEILPSLVTRPREVTLPEDLTVCVSR